MLVKSMTEEEIHEIGHAFGYYDYGHEGCEIDDFCLCAYGAVIHTLKNL